MAIRVARGFRPIIAIAALGAAALAAPTLASATPNPKPSSIPAVQKQLGELALQNSQIVEKYDRAQVAVQQREQVVHRAELAAAQANAEYQREHTRFALTVQAQYENNSFGAAGALLDSSSGNNYLDRLNTLNMVSAQTAQIVQSMSEAKDKATNSAAAAETLLAAARSERDALSKQRTQVEAQIRKYQTLLATLSSAQQYAYQRAMNPSVSSSSLATMHLTQATSAGARRAVQFALNQVGKPYVFGAAGPSSYDCSGLTMAAWQAGGVSLPHSAADQYNYGHHVTRSELQPGDLIFFYQPIGHVTIYIGDGMMVSAPTEGQDVSVVPLSAFNSDYVGATRLT